MLFGMVRLISEMLFVIFLCETNFDPLENEFKRK